MSKLSRKRIKLECEECGSQFDDDYKKRHETTKHEGKHVKVKYVGAPSNPFEASKRKLGVTSHQQSPNSLSPNLDTPGHHPPATDSYATSLKHSAHRNIQLPADSITVSSQNISEIPILFSEGPKALLRVSPSRESPEPSTSFTEPSFNSTSPSKETDASVTWIEFAGKISEFLTYFEQMNQVLTRMKNEAVPNLTAFFVDAADCLESINEESAKLLEIAKEEDMKFARNKSHTLHVGNEVLVDHDPAKRKKISTTNERKYLSALGPYQPKLDLYPIDAEIPKTKQCRFNPVWYSEYPLLEYSPYKDAAFCFACILFPEGIGRSQASPEWTSVGVRQWHNMKSRGENKKGKLIQHFTSKSHEAAIRDYCNFVNEGVDIDALLDKSIRANKIQEEQEKEYHSKVLQILIDVARTLGRQGLAFRGHDDTLQNSDGNFLQVVHLISRHCPLMKKWLDETSRRPHHVTYLAPVSQNDFIDLLGTETQKAIVNEVEKADIFSVMADTTPDSSHQDRLAVNIRYVVQMKDELIPIERLLKMDVVLTKKTGEDLSNKIVSALQSMTIPIKKIAFQSYDYAKNMSGKYIGTQKKLSEKCEKDIPYIPCQAHRTNTFVETACNASALITEFFNVLEALYVFFYGSTNRFKRLREQLKSIENSLQLKNLSKTRWTARAETVKAVWIAVEGIVHVLTEIKNDSVFFDNKTCTLASGLLKKILDFDFISCLYFCKNVMFKVKHLTENLEAEELNVIDALLLIQSTSASFQQMDDDEQINALINSSVVFAKKLEISPEDDFKKHHRTRRVPKKYDERPETAHQFDFQTFYRKEFRTVLQVFNTGIQDNLKEAFSAFAPVQEVFQIAVNRKNVTIESVKAMMQLDPIFLKGDPECLYAELQILLDSCQECENFKDISKVALNLKNVIPLAYKLVYFILTAPVTSASCERSFSKLKIVLNHLRTTMGDDRLNSSMLLYSSKDKVDLIRTMLVIWFKYYYRLTLHS